MAQLTPLTDPQFNQLLNYLQGTCHTLNEALETLFDLSEDDIPISDNHRLDEHMFCCEQCGWWYEQAEMTENPSVNGDWVCVECVPNEE